MSNEDNIFLFDMDGTLTLPRKIADSCMEKTLQSLSEYGKIAIVTGSGIDYVIQQCSVIWENNSALRSRIILLPCNGTQAYTFSSNDKEWKCSFKENMRDKMGNGFIDMMDCLLRSQYYFIDRVVTRRNIEYIPLTGDFISYRDSLVNWCPIGRNALDEDRDVFINLDKDNNIRLELLSYINDYIEELGLDITCSLGGSTSIDIYPTGWDKTFALRHFKNSKCWFIGDKCTGVGNDRPIYDLLKRDHRAFQTRGPSETTELIYEIIDTLSGRNI